MRRRDGKRGRELAPKHASASVASGVFNVRPSDGLYEPPWKYPPKEFALDLSYHLVYGVGLGAAYAALERRP